MNCADKLDTPVMQLLKGVVNDLGVEAYIIGGFVRDLVLGRPVKDIDVVVIGDGIALANAVAEKIGNTNVKIFKTFGTAMLRYEDWEIEFVGARKESYSEDSRKPSVTVGTLSDDQLRRDFTINALALSLEASRFGEMVDPFDGLNDLAEKAIKTPTDPEVTYSDDPLRMMRAVRFSAQLGFKIEKSSLDAISKLKDRIKIVSGERIITELNKIILSKKPSIGFKVLFETGLLEIIFPEMTDLYGVEERNGQKHKDNFFHTLKVLDNVAKVSDNLWLRWSAILHDIAKPATKRYAPGTGWTFHGHEDRGARMVPDIFKRLKLPLDSKMKYVQKLVALHLRPIALTKEEATDSAIRRLLFDAGDDIDDLMILCKCDITSKNASKVKRFLANYDVVKQKLIEVEEKDRVRNWQPPISGAEIMDIFNLKPSKEVGILKNKIKEAILDGKIHNDYDEAVKFMIEEGKQLGISPKS